MPVVQKRICVLASDITSSTVSLIIKGIMKKAYEYGYDVCVFAPLIKDSGRAEYQHGEKNIYKLPNFERFAGVIVVEESIRMAHAAEEIKQWLREKCTCPVVVLGEDATHYESLTIDEEKTMEYLVDHLIEEHGFTNIHCLTGAKEDYHARERLAGYMKSLHKHGITVEEGQYNYSDCLLDSAVEYAYSIAHGMMEKPEAIVCFNDTVAVMMAKEFMIQGVVVPRDIVVTGFNSNEEGTGFIPCITSAIPPCGIHGENAVVRLHNKIEGRNEDIIRSAVGELAIGQSCGCKNDLHYERRKREQQMRIGSFSEHYFDSNFMEENLTSAATIEDCLGEINWYTYQLNKFKELYVCLVDEETMPGEIIRDGYTEQILLRTKNKNGDAKVVRESFSVEEMLPALYEERDYPTTYYFTPLHFKDRCLGYIAINFGNDIVTYDPYYPTWVRNINNAIEIIRNQSELRRMNEKLNHLAMYDGLTGAYNRFGLDQLCGNIIGQCRRSDKMLVLLEGDLDNLKRINDEFGHLEGDIAIATIASAFRESIGQDACLARLGGDEFVVLFNGEYGETHITEVEEKVKRHLERFNETSGKPYKVEVSIGHHIENVKGWKQSDREIMEFFLNRADQVMYTNKKKERR